MSLSAAIQRRKTGGPRHLMTVERHEAVGQVMDAIALASDALITNGAAVQLLQRMNPGPERDEALRATHDTHAHLMQLLADLRARAGALDGDTNGA